MAVLTKCIFLYILACLFLLGASQGADPPDDGPDPNSVKLSDIKVLTLRNASMTAGRRSSPVPQLKCVGGTAGCVFKPQNVQCYNRGSDGNDIQWECKTDMIKRYRFGTISVSCEGFSNPTDPFILRGSCGLEYTIDLTNEGDTQKSKAADTMSSPTTEVKNDVKFDQTRVTTDEAGGGMKADQKGGNKSPNEDDGKMEGAGWFGAIPVILVFAAIAYFVYTKCIKSHTEMPNIPNPFQSNPQQPPPEPGFIGGYPSNNDPFRANFPTAPGPGSYPPAPMYPQLPPAQQQPAGWPVGPEASGGYNPTPSSTHIEQPTVTYTSVPTHDLGSPTHAGDENEMRKASGFGGTARR